MTGPYIYTDPSGDFVLVTSAADGVEVMVTDAKHRHRAAVTITSGRLAEFVTGLYQQAGRPVPVLINPDEVADGWVRHPKGGAA